MPVLSDYVHTFGQAMLVRFGERIHKITLSADFSCPNRDGSKGIGGCTFCNNASFNPSGRQPPTLSQQLENGRRVIRKRTGASRYIAYFQTYTNTYGGVQQLRALYQQALNEPDVVGLAVGTRPDCVPDPVLDLLAGYQDAGYEVWLELGLQSAFDATLQRVNRGHDFAAYRDTVRRARARDLQICTHLIIGLPGEGDSHFRNSLERVLELGVDGLKLHPLHVVKGTQLANQWRRGEYQPMCFERYVDTAADLIMRTPPQVIFHRVTATASPSILLAPEWCARKWSVLNAITAVLQRRQRRLAETSRCDDYRDAG